MFTLLELLAGIAVMSILVAGVCGVLPACFRLRNRVSDLLEAPLPRQYLVEVLRRDLLAAVPPGGVLAAGLTGEYEEEDSETRLDTIEFVTAAGRLDADEPWGDLMKVEYYLEEAEDEEDYELVRVVTRNLLAYEEDSEDEEDQDEEVLLTGVRSLEITYYDGEDWQDSWDSQGQDGTLPVAVKVLIEFVADDSEADENGEEDTQSLELVVPCVVQVRPSATEEGEGDSQQGEGDSQQQGGEQDGVDGASQQGGGGLQGGQL